MYMPLLFFRQDIRSDNETVINITLVYKYLLKYAHFNEQYHTVEIRIKKKFKKV